MFQDDPLINHSAAQIHMKNNVQPVISQISTGSANNNSVVLPAGNTKGFNNPSLSPPVSQDDKSLTESPISSTEVTKTDPETTV
ncbi:unnamed protein product, partial [Allacma fusca]